MVERWLPVPPVRGSIPLAPVVGNDVWMFACVAQLVEAAVLETAG